MEISEINKLICGNYFSTPSLESLYKIINENIENIIFSIKELLETEDFQKIKIYFPFLLRNLLETTCNASLGRIDPFRLICVHKSQLSTSYTIGEKNGTSINWQNDIQGEGDKRIVWEKYDGKRSLFCKKTEEIFWKPAFYKLINDKNFTELECSENYKKLELDSIVPFLRTKSQKIFSSLSKGVHSELLIDNEIIYDKTTLYDLLDETIEFCSILALLTNYIDISFNKIEDNIAIKIYDDIYNWREKINGE